MEKATSDEKIVELYFARDEEAIALTEKKHGALILSICRNILKNEQDAQECSNTVYYKAWSKIPPERPKSLPAFLAFLARACAVDKYREKTRKKRAVELSSSPFEELEDFLFDDRTPEDVFSDRELSRVLNAFLRSLPDDERRLFIRRYYFEEPVDRIAESRGISRRTLYVHLGKIKEKLKKTLKKE